LDALRHHGRRAPTGMSEITRLGVLLSGTGRTLENLIRCIRRGTLPAQVACVISDRDGVRGLDIAREADLPHYIEVDSGRTFDILREHDVDLVCLCGYQRLLEIPAEFNGRVINIHPALLPKHGGKGYYGHHVHEAVLASGDTESGCSVHFCTAEYDEGPVLLQRRVPVEPGDTADTLAARVFEQECVAYPEAIRLWIQQHQT
ncbi:MAG: phosphoribosylglycinamide formyltransferase, partial [Planctomycetota bacterium]